MISSENLLKLLNDWNLWEGEMETGIERKQYVNRLIPLFRRKEIIVIKGIRRSGKSTIMRQMMKNLVKSGVQEKQLLFLNLEDYNLKDSLSIELLENTLELFKSRINSGKKTYFFIDEVQLVPEWERFLRTKYDLNENIKFIVSGSNASLLSKELSTLLTGRNITIEVKPLNYLEFKDFRSNGSIEEFLTFGGFPEVVLEKNRITKKIILQQYFEDIINKDIINRHRIRNRETVFDLARYLIENSGGKHSMNRLSKTLGVDDKTVNEYVSYMVDAFIIVRVPFFSYSLKKRFNKATQTKYYSADNGFLQITSLNFTKDKGKRFENVMALTINMITNDIAYWSENCEVDFVFGNSAVNVTVSETSIPKRESEGLLCFRDKNKMHKLFLVTPLGKTAAVDTIEVMAFEDFCKKIILNENNYSY